jgi:hypothetical protein
MNSILKLTALLVLLIPALAHAQTNADACRVSSPKEEKTLFQSTDSADARTAYGKNWSGLSIGKRVSVGKLVYTVGFVCENAKNKHKR